MAFVSVTRLRIRSLRFLPRFILHSLLATRQARRAEGFLGGALLPDRRRTFWTMTVWRDEADMRRYMGKGAHRAAMPRLRTWCDEASVVHWTQPEPAPPDWAEADRRMRAEGRPSALRYPAPTQADGSYAPPRTSGAAPLRPIATE